MRMLIDWIILLALLAIFFICFKCQIIFMKHNSLACLLYKIEKNKKYNELFKHLIYCK